MYRYFDAGCAPVVAGWTSSW